ncbi:5-formyltetrahydrofolate cyclo-ligase [Teredinibacter waterburyi]|uniref:5-formyltetrahydrofolate cyclo-ligase n=1 Tax=Teredinibacter waterburyi TaxID=1500538 RepID=UPI001FE9EF64|nr:5-formyltetrahydrofolate cyclo-ligase [Teredinibacter waterburyi]
MPTSTVQRSSLRKQLRAERRALSVSQQAASSLSLLAQLRRQRVIQNANTIALYFACDGEISPHLFARWALRHNKILCFPCVNACQQMVFRRFMGANKLIRNRFNILQPHPSGAAVPAANIDVVLMPLVGFDRSGNRLGMGGGFYDRYFAYKRRRPHARPYLIGLAHSLQEIESLEGENWDIPLDAIATESDFLKIVASIPAPKTTPKLAYPSRTDLRNNK